jgi:lysyl endopeptidase
MKRTTLIVGLFLVLGAIAALPAAAGPVATGDLETLRAAIFAPATQSREKVGEEVRMTFRSPSVPLPKRGELGELEKSLVWQQEITWPEATYIAPFFDHFNLPGGAKVVVRSPDGSRSWAYTGQGKADLGVTEGFWGIHIPGETAVVELWAASAVPEGAVVVGGFAHGLRNWERPWSGGPVEKKDKDPGITNEAICGSDDSNWAQCYQTSEPVIYEKSRAVARLLINGSSACTGWLVGDAGHLLTNEHCIGTSSEALNTDYEFMAERSCSTSCASFGACPGTVVAVSGTLVKLNASLDYSLILLPVNPTATYGFFQMRTSGAVLDERIYIPGHPGAYGKKIAVTSGHSTDASGYCEVYSTNATPCSGGPGDTGYYCDTQGGSSGSPVVAYGDHAVISLHHCANCPNRGVPIDAVISNLGSSLPPNSTVGGTPPPPPTCGAVGTACTSNSECCSNSCKGKPGNKTCK